MVWIKTDAEHQSKFKKPWMDEPVVWSSKQTANVAEDVAERLVDERDDISYLNDPPDADADATATETTDDGATDDDNDESTTDHADDSP